MLHQNGQDFLDIQNMFYWFIELLTPCCMSCVFFINIISTCKAFNTWLIKFKLFILCYLGTFRRFYMGDPQNHLQFRNTFLFNFFIIHIVFWETWVHLSGAGISFLRNLLENIDNLKAFRRKTMWWPLLFPGIVRISSS